MKLFMTKLPSPLTLGEGGTIIFNRRNYMEKFNITNPCRKCGFGSLLTKIPDDDANVGCDAKTLADKDDGKESFVLERTCRRCGYQWKELSLDYNF